MCNKLTSKKNTKLPEIKVKAQMEAQGGSVLRGRAGVGASQYSVQDGRQSLWSRWEGSGSTGSGIKLGAFSLSASNM